MVVDEGNPAGSSNPADGGIVTTDATILFALVQAPRNSPQDRDHAPTTELVDNLPEGARKPVDSIAFHVVRAVHHESKARVHRGELALER